MVVMEYCHRRSITIGYSDYIYYDDLVTVTCSDHQPEVILSKKTLPMPKEKLKPIQKIFGRSIIKVNKRINSRPRG